MKFSPEYRATLEAIFSELSAASSKGAMEPKNAMAADLVSVGDSWLSYAIRDRLIEPIKNAEEQDWFKGLSDRWKVRYQMFESVHHLQFFLVFDRFIVI